MITLNLISESDSDGILKILQEKYPHCKWEIDIGPTYDTDHNRVEIRTDMPNEQIKELSVKIRKIQDEIENIYGEAVWEWYGKCKCGNSARIFDSETFCEYYCTCVECDSIKFREVHGIEECRICGKKYDSYKEKSFRTHLEVHVCDESIRQKAEDEYIKKENAKMEADENYYPDSDKQHLEQEKRTKKNSFIYELGYDIHTIDINKSECCSLECAKKAYIEWLDRVICHPFTKECLEFKKNERLKNNSELKETRKNVKPKR